MSNPICRNKYSFSNLSFQLTPAVFLQIHISRASALFSFSFLSNPKLFHSLLHSKPSSCQFLSQTFVQWPTKQYSCPVKYFFYIVIFVLISFKQSVSSVTWFFETVFLVNILTFQFNVNLSSSSSCNYTFRLLHFYCHSISFTSNVKLLQYLYDLFIIANQNYNVISIWYTLSIFFLSIHLSFHQNILQ